MAKAGRLSPERDWQNTIVDTLEVFGYVTEHTYPLRTQHGWRTGSTLRGKPDIMALRPPRQLAIEVKMNDTYPTREQVAVLSLHALIPCHRAWVIRPRDPWQDFIAWVRHPKTAPAAYGFDPLDEAEAKRVLAEEARKRKEKAAAKAAATRGKRGNGQGAAG